jgi:hypothetical protein
MPAHTSTPAEGGRQFGPEARPAAAGTRWLLLLLALVLLAAGAWLIQRQWRYARARAAGDWARAAAIWPANAEALRQAAAAGVLTSPRRALAEAQAAVAADGEDWNNWAVLASSQFVLGDMTGARRSMQQVLRMGAGYFAAHWRYTELLLVAGDKAGFWSQAEQALAMAPAQDVEDVIPQLWDAAGGQPAPFNQTLAAARRASSREHRSAIARAALQFLVEQNQLEPAQFWWMQALSDPRTPAANHDLTPIGLQFESALVTSAQPLAARRVWQQGVGAGVFDPADGPGGDNLVTNPDLQRPLGVAATDWRLCFNCGAAVSTSAGLRLEFDGQEADDGIVAQQWLLLDPSRDYRLQVTASADAPAGVFLKVLGFPRSGQADFARVDVAGGGPASGGFRTAPVTCLYLLQVGFQRPLGSMPLHGVVELTHFAVRPVAP